MKEEILSSARRVTDERVAAVFADPLRRRVLLHLAGGEYSISELAAKTALELKRLHYHVLALCDLGLVVIARERARRGRPIKVYRAIATAFFVPSMLAEEGPGSMLSGELRASLDRHQRASRAGIVYTTDDHGRPTMRFVQNNEARGLPTAEAWKVLRLSREDAARLAREVAACLDRFAASARAGTQTYLVHFAAAPRRA